MADATRAPMWRRPLVLAMALGLVSFHVAVCARAVRAGGGNGRMAAKTILEVLEEYTDEWMAIPGVVGTAIGELDGKPCIKILAAERTEEMATRIPSEVEGFPVVIMDTGELRALE